MFDLGATCSQALWLEGLKASKHAFKKNLNQKSQPVSQNRQDHVGAVSLMELFYLHLSTVSLHRGDMNNMNKH